MSRNWQADTNPHPKDDWKTRKSREAAPGSPIYLTDGSTYVPLRQLPQRVTEAIYEAVEKFIRQHPTPRGV